MNENEYNLQVLKKVYESIVPVGASALCKELNYSQATIGRILAKYEEKGYLVKISNKGRIITDAGVEVLRKYQEKENRLDTAKNIIHHVSKPTQKTLAEILEIRKNLEPICAKKACMNATDSEMRELQSVLLEYMQAIYRGELGNEQDLKLHLKIAELSKNNMLHLILSLLLTTDNAFTTFAMVTRSREVEIMEWHKDIVSAIVDRDPDRAADSMLKHLGYMEIDETG